MGRVGEKMEFEGDDQKREQELFDPGALGLEIGMAD